MIYFLNYSEVSTPNSNFQELCELLKCFQPPFTIVQEIYHIDRSYRDSYYTYFSNQHFEVKRFSRRLSFFKGRIRKAEFFSSNSATCKRIARNFMGCCVVNPLVAGNIGRTLINPNYLIHKSDRPIYIRLSKFNIHILGNALSVSAFPYRMQDESTTRCAEVTMLNLIEYYSNSYSDYRYVLPSEILETEQIHSYERVFPSKGIQYPVFTKVLSELGFSPREYDLSYIETSSISSLTPEDSLKRILHYYIESGIPVAINLSQIGSVSAGHSMACIGHGKLNSKLIKNARRRKLISWEERDTCHPLIDAADLYDEYVVVDDNEPVYQVRKFNHLSLSENTRIENIAVPLYKRMFLDAPDAAAIIRSILHDTKYGISFWANDFLNPNEDVITRLFMASSNSLKSFRTKTLNNTEIRQFYAMVPMPRFVWVCELYRMGDYDNFNAFADIVIDATSVANGGHSHNSLILMHYQNKIFVRFPDQPGKEMDEMFKIEDDSLFPGYTGNLTEILP